MSVEKWSECGGIPTNPSQNPPVFGYRNNGGKKGLLSKVRQDSGKKKGIRRFYLPNSLIFSVARTGDDPATS